MQGELRPDFTIILDLDPELGLERARARGELDRFEVEQMEFFNRVRQCYLEIAQNEPGRCAVIDASAELAEVKASLLQTLVTRLSPYIT